MFLLIQCANYLKKKEHEETKNMGGKYFCCIVFNLLHGFVETTAFGLAEQKTPSLIITYTGTLIESTCSYNEGKDSESKSLFSPLIFLPCMCLSAVHW